MVRASCGRCITTPAYNLLFRRSYSSSAPPFPAPPSFTSAADAVNHSKSMPTSKAAEMFEKERERQRSLISRVEKIELRFLGAPQDCSLLMNKNLSTPNDCARHMAEKLIKRSAVAEIDGKVWDMHRPLEHNCVMRLISLDTPDKALQDANTAFWRSCTVVLGAVASNAFKDEIKAIPHSFPPPNVRSGSFVYDVVLDGLKEWNPTKDELRLLSTQMVKIAKEDHPFEYLKVRLPTALEIMADNPFKVHQLPKIAETTDGDVTLYRMGDYVDVSKGPMISRTSFLGRCTVTSVQRIKTGSSLDLYRFQGVALPNSILLNHFAYGLIEERGRKFNGGRLPEVAAAIG